MTPHDICRCGRTKQIVSRLCKACSTEERRDPERRRKALTDRFWSRVSRTDTCWLWTGSMDRHGYGVFNNRVLPSSRAHRIAYILERGDIPEGLELDHLCRNPSCVNPLHLDPVTHRENLLRGRGIAARAARVTHCPASHAYDEANTYVNKHGHRACRACHRRRVAEAWARRKAAR